LKEREGRRIRREEREWNIWETRLMPYLMDSFFFPFIYAIYTLVLPLYL
jgi:hypothetical protein